MRPPNDDEPWPFPIASRPGERPHAPRHNTILVHHRRNEPRRRCQLGHQLAFTKNAQEPNVSALAESVGSQPIIFALIVG